MIGIGQYRPMQSTIRCGDSPITCRNYYIDTMSGQQK